VTAPTLVVMAAGIGRRYGGLKQVDPVGPGGEMILDYSVHDALAAGFGRAVFVIRRDIENVFRERIGRRLERRIETAYAFQELDALPEGFAVPAGREKPWGTGHAVLAAREAVAGNFAVINADDFYGAASFRALGEHLRSARDAEGLYDYAMVGFELAKTLSEHGHVARGICRVTGEGLLEEIHERTRIERRGGAIQYTGDGEAWTDLAPDAVVSMNMWGFTPGYFEELAARFVPFLRERLGDPKAEFFVPTVVNDLVAEGRARVRVLPTPERWVGVTYREDLQSVRRAIRALVDRGVYPERLWGNG